MLDGMAAAHYIVSVKVHYVPKEISILLIVLSWILIISLTFKINSCELKMWGFSYGY
jgi:hypothetical protein